MEGEKSRDEPGLGRALGWRSENISVRCVPGLPGLCTRTEPGMLVVAIPSIAPFWPAFTHAQSIHLPLPLHRQHEDGMETDTKLQVALVV